MKLSTGTENIEYSNKEFIYLYIFILIFSYKKEDVKNILEKYNNILILTLLYQLMYINV